MKAFATLCFSLLTLFFWGSPLAYADALRCEALATQAPDNVRIEARLHAPNKDVTASFCLVSGVMAQRMGVDGKRYAVRFELRLPQFWQGRFAYQFDSGYGGEVAPAIGKLTGLTSRQFAINQGFAVVSSNGGHDATQYPEAGLAGFSGFGHDPEARRYYGYATMQALNPIARALVESYYQAPIRYAYGLGQSHGGRMAMVAASRFPEMFDGLLIGYPGFNSPKAALQHAWDVQALRRVDDKIQHALSKRDLIIFTKKLLDECDALDGISDDMIFAVEACQAKFQPTALVCKSRFDRDCLPLNTVAALIRMHRGPHNSQNQSLYASWVYDTGMRSDNWRMWKVESTLSGLDNQPMGAVVGAAALAHLFSTPPSRIPGDIYALEHYLFSFDFDKDAPKIYATNQEFKTSAMALMTPPDAIKPTLTEFKAAGGKMILFHGNSDPVFSVKDTVRWYDFLDFGLVGRAHEFVRLYRVPGMPHGEGGPSADRFNLLQPLVSWVEINQAPQEVVAATRAENPEITARMAGITRPLCPYPAYAQYQQGDLRQASSFQCVVSQ